MLPRRQSIFHLGEEGDAVHHRPSLVGTAMTGGARRVRDRERLVVGLQILVHHTGQQHHHHHHGRNGHPHAANIVLKKMVTPPRAAVTAATRRAVSPCSFFLEACSLCRLELSHNKDVYMYRGDQGFCSEDCRWQQILVDETREREAEAAVVSKGHQRRGQHRRHSSHHTPIRGRMPRKTLAVA